MSSDEKKLQEWMNSHDGEDYCTYCLYSDECHGMSLGPNGPIYPPCCSKNIEDLLDTEAILDDIENGEW